MNNDLICIATQNLFSQWHDEIKHTVWHFSFKDYVKDVYGFTYSGNYVTFNYTIIDEQKFMIFVLKYTNRNSQ